MHNRSRTGITIGDLRAALLTAARAVVEEAGVEALTLREAARRAGVSPAAPYHHFKDKAEVVRELARQGFEELDQHSAESLAGRTAPQERLQAIGTAYVMYAVQNPAMFRLICRPEKGSPFEDPSPENALVLRVLLGVIDDFVAAGEYQGDRAAAALAAWSLVHGFAVLVVDGPLHRMAADPARIRALAEWMTSTPPWPPA